MKRGFISVLIVIALAGMMVYVVQAGNTYLPIVMDMPTLTPTETPTPLPTATAAPQNSKLVFDLYNCLSYTTTTQVTGVGELSIQGGRTDGSIYDAASSSYGMWVDGVYYSYSSMQMWSMQDAASPYSAYIIFVTPDFQMLLYMYHQGGTPRHSCAH